MAYLRVIAFSILVLAGIAPIPASAYDRNTHEGITKAIVGGYEKLHGDTFDSSEEQKIIAGSSAEDDDARFLNHFYDPINYRGLTVLGIPLGQPSESWAYDTRRQASWRCVAYFPCSHDIGYNDKLFSSATDYSWDRAIYDYVYGDKQRGLEVVGHALHLLEDATVPAHVRNDQHGHIGSVGDADPYETFTSQFNSANIPVPNDLSKIPTYSSLSSYLDHVARFTSTHFLSKDTLFKDYALPDVKRSIISEGYVLNSDTIRISTIEKTKDSLGRQSVVYSTKDDLVLVGNWNALSKEAVINGIGVIDLFFKSVEQEKKTGVIKAKNISASEQNAKDLAKNGFKYVKGLYGSSLNQSDVEDLLNDNAGQAGAAALATSNNPPPQQNTVSNKPVAPRVIGDNQKQQRSTPKVLGAVVSREQESEPAPALDPVKSQVHDLPSAASHLGSFNGGSQTQPSTDTSSSTLFLSVLSPFENEIFATTSVAFTGTTSAVSIVTATFDSTQATTTTDGNGNWTFTFALASGTRVISFSAATSTLFSATSTRSIIVDTAPSGAPSLSISECSASFVTADCTVATTTITLMWPSVSDAVYYRVIKNNIALATSTATTATSIIAVSTTTTFAVVAYKSNGLAATSTEKNVFVTTQPLIISEIAWAGTNASSDDEWIELKNMTNSPIDLSHFVITTPDGSRTIEISDTIGAAGFFLIERNSEATSISSPHATTINFSQLSDAGEQLLLQWGNGIATTTIDSTPLVTTCNGWCAGADLGFFGYSVQQGTSTAQRSMERKNSSPDGSLATSWQTVDGYSFYASDRLGNTINSTANGETSAGRPDAGWFCSPGTVSISSGVHYTPPGSFCTYLMRAISIQTNRYGALYRGDVGSSTLIDWDFDGHAYLRQRNIIIPNPQNGEHFFIAIYEARVGPAHDSYPTDDSTRFDVYFSTGMGVLPHDNYFIIPWIYGP